MRNRRSNTRKLNLLSTLELLDETVRRSAAASSYLGSTTQLAVAEAIRRARRPNTKAITPRPDQMQLTAVAA